jgi:hypothetical protein
MMPYFIELEVKNNNIRLSVWNSSPRKAICSRDWSCAQASSINDTTILGKGSESAQNGETYAPIQIEEKTNEVESKLYERLSFMKWNCPKNLSGIQ